MKNEILYSRIVIVIGSIILLILVCALSSKNSIITITPYTLSSETWITNNNGSRSYKEAWGLFFAQELGNITPETVGFIEKRIGPLLSPKIFSQFMSVLNNQASHIREDRVTLRFEPKSVVFEEETNKVFVTGYIYTKSVSGKEEHEIRTYEFIINIGNYLPILESIQLYRDQPRTKKQLKYLENKQKSRDYYENK